MTGSNLTGIMETMKFAYHATSYNDFLNLKNQISSANFTYKMSTSMEFSESTYDVIMINTIYTKSLVKVDILYSNCSHITFELNWVFILNFGSFFLLLRLQNIFSFELRLHC